MCLVFHREKQGGESDRNCGREVEGGWICALCLCANKLTPIPTITVAFSKVVSTDSWDVIKKIFFLF